MSRGTVHRGVASLALVPVLLLGWAGTAAAAPPQIVSVAVAENSVTAGSVTLEGSINANGVATSYSFEYITEAAYEANLAAEPPRAAFAGALSIGGSVGGGSAQPVKKPISGLMAATPYRFRLRAAHAAEEPVFSVTRPFATQEATNVFELLDHRGWEMVSPIEKAGGAIQPPGGISGGGVFQAAAGGGAFTFSSADSFGAGAQGAPAGSQYVAARGAGGWIPTNISTPLLAGSYGSEPDGPPYQLFSGDLGFGLLSNGERCRGQVGGECPVANPPLPGSGAPAGFRDYYRRNAAGGFQSLLTAADLDYTSLGADQLEVRLVAVTPDLAHVVLSSCAALTANATEVAAPDGCDPEAQNLYEWSGGGLSLVNLLPGQATGTPGARIAAANGAISSDGSRVYFTQGGGIYLRDGNATVAVLEGAGGEEFGAAPGDGSTAYLVDSGNLARFSAATGNLTPLTGGGGVEGILGVSADGSTVYYADSSALLRREGAATTEIASSALAANWPAATGAARVSADGLSVVFLSKAELTGYPNEGATEVFHYGPPPGGGAAVLSCVSCNPTGERPQGSAAIPGARPNGTGADVTDSYKPRALSSDGHRVFFETTDSLVSRDTNAGVADVYEWEARGEGTCARIGGCVQLISGGHDLQPSYLLDADEDGGEAFFLAAASLYPPDPGSYDVYVAREGGGFPAPEEPTPCVADSCQILPEAPEDPTPGTLVPNSGNPALKVTGAQGKPQKPKKPRKHKGKKSKKRSRHHARAAR